MIIAALFIVQSLIAVPDAVRQKLDTMCAGWQLARVLPEVAEDIKGRTPSWTTPSARNTRAPAAMPGFFATANGARSHASHSYRCMTQYARAAATRSE